MRQSKLFTLVFLLVLSFWIYVAIGLKDDQKQIDGCSETDRIKTTSAYSFTYCKDNDKVLSRDSTWISPSKNPKREEE